ncbi:MAG: type II secretion system F family protein [Actinomycetota bacterium]
MTSRPVPSRRPSSQRRKSLVAFLASALLLLASASTAFGQEAEPAAVAPELLLVDATAEPFAVIRTAAEPAKVDIVTGGVRAETQPPTPVGTSELQVQTALVIDNSAESAEFLDAFKAAAIDYVEQAPSSELIEVWTTGGTARLRVGLNTEHDRTALIIDGIVSAEGGNKLWDGVRGATLEFEEPVAGATNVVVFTGNVDNGSVSTPAQARGAVLTGDASIFMVHGGETTSPEETRLVNVSAGGAYALSEDEAVLAAYGTSVAEAITNTYVVAFDGDGVANGVSIDVIIEGATISGSYSFGAATDGRALAPIAAPQPTTLPGLSFLEGSTGKNIGLLLGAIAAALGAWSIVSMFSKDTSGLNDVLEAYADPYAQSPAGAADDGGSTSFAKNLFVKRAVEITEGIAERQGTLERAEALLERADMPLRAGEAFTAYAGVVLGALAIGLVVIGGPIGALVLGAMGFLIPPAVVRFLANRRTKAFMGQLPDTLQLLSSTLKAGYSFMQGVEAVSHEVEEPMGGELRRIVTEAQLGRPLEEAMDASAERMESEDFAWAVMAVKIQREVGGNLSELLMTVAETMTARERLRRDVAALTAEGKMSAIVLGVLPILLGMAMWAMNKEYINTLFTDSLGKILLGASIVSALIGFAWMKKIIDIEI